MYFISLVLVIVFKLFAQIPGSTGKKFSAEGLFF